MTDQDRTSQRTTLLLVVGLTFTSLGIAIDVDASYGFLSWIFLGLGILIPFVAVVLAARTNDASDEEQGE